MQFLRCWSSRTWKENVKRHFLNLFTVNDLLYKIHLLMLNPTSLEADPELEQTMMQMKLSLKKEQDTQNPMLSIVLHHLFLWRNLHVETAQLTHHLHRHLCEVTTTSLQAQLSEIDLRRWQMRTYTTIFQTLKTMGSLKRSLRLLSLSFNWTLSPRTLLMFIQRCHLQINSKLSQFQAVRLTL